MKLFGSILNVETSVGTTVFVCCFFALVILEEIFEYVDHLAKEYGYDGIMDKLRKELMMMGLISFAIFLYSQSTYNQTNYNTFHSFEICHILTFFLAVTFVIQAGLLIKYANKQKQRLLTAVRSQSKDLLTQLDGLKGSKKTVSSLCFYYFPSWFPFFPILRTYIEIKIVSRFFIKRHNLPKQFNFAKYFDLSFRTYIAELGDIPPVNWFILACLVLINYLRVEAIDKESKKCGNHHHYTEECVNYTLGYITAVVYLLTAFILTTFICGAKYYDKLVSFCMLRENIDTEEVGRYGFKDLLKILNAIETEQIVRYQKSLHDQNRKDINTGAKIFIDMDSDVKENNVDNHLNQKEKSGLHSMKHLSQEIKRSKIKKEHSEDALRSLNCVQRIMIKINAYVYGINKHDEQDEQDEHDEHDDDACDEEGHKGQDGNFKMSDLKGKIRNIYLFKSPKLFFKMVELTLLFQCCYLSLFLTQVSFLLKMSDYVVEWFIIFLFPIIFNYFIVREIIYLAIVLRSVTSLEEELVGEVLEDCIQEANVLDTVRNAIRSKLAAVNIPTQDWKAYIKFLFDSFDLNKSGKLSKFEFREFLAYLHIYMRKKSFQLLWENIDTDFSKKITWDELFVLTFPEYKQEFKDELKIVSVFKKLVNENLFRNHGLTKKSPIGRRKECFQLLFNKYDTNMNGSIDKHEFRQLLGSIGFKVESEKSFLLFYAAVGNDELQNGGGGVSFSDIFSVFNSEKKFNLGSSSSGMSDSVYADDNDTEVGDHIYVSESSRHAAYEGFTDLSQRAASTKSKKAYSLKTAQTANDIESNNNHTYNTHDDKAALSHQGKGVPKSPPRGPPSPSSPPPSFLLEATESLNSRNFPKKYLSPAGLARENNMNNSNNKNGFSPLNRIRGEAAYYEDD